MRCSFCKKYENFESKELWTTDTGDKIEVPKSSEISALDPRNPEDYIICERCYLSGATSNFRDSELHELHTGFGLEYLRNGKADKAEVSLRKALALKATADSLSNVACCIHESSKDEAKKLYLLALDLEPDHFISRSNLKNLTNG